MGRRLPWEPVSHTPDSPGVQRFENGRGEDIVENDVKILDGAGLGSSARKGIYDHRGRVIEELMRPTDRSWIMVEDEFVATARLFTRHLHEAEYRRLREMHDQHHQHQQQQQQDRHEHEKQPENHRPGQGELHRNPQSSGSTFSTKQLTCATEPSAQSGVSTNSSTHAHSRLQMRQRTTTTSLAQERASGSLPDDQVGGSSRSGKTASSRMRRAEPPPFKRARKMDQSGKGGMSDDGDASGGESDGNPRGHGNARLGDISRYKNSEKGGLDAKGFSVRKRREMAFLEMLSGSRESAGDHQLLEGSNGVREGQSERGRMQMGNGAAEGTNGAPREGGGGGGGGGGRGTEGRRYDRCGGSGDGPVWSDNRSTVRSRTDAGCAGTRETGPTPLDVAHRTSSYPSTERSVLTREKSQTARTRARASQPKRTRSYFDAGSLLGTTLRDPDYKDKVGDSTNDVNRDISVGNERDDSSSENGDDVDDHDEQLTEDERRRRKARWKKTAPAQRAAIVRRAGLVSRLAKFTRSKTVPVGGAAGWESGSDGRNCGTGTQKEKETGKKREDGKNAPLMASAGKDLRRGRSMVLEKARWNSGHCEVGGNYRADGGSVPGASGVIGAPDAVPPARVPGTAKDGTKLRHRGPLDTNERVVGYSVARGQDGELNSGGDGQGCGGGAHDFHSSHRSRAARRTGDACARNRCHSAADFDLDLDLKLDPEPNLNSHLGLEFGLDLLPMSSCPPSEHELDHDYDYDHGGGKEECEINTESDTEITLVPRPRSPRSSPPPLAREISQREDPGTGIEGNFSHKSHRRGQDLETVRGRENQNGECDSASDRASGMPGRSGSRSADEPEDLLFTVRRREIPEFVRRRLERKRSEAG